MPTIVSDFEEHLTTLIAGHQGALHSYILALLANRAMADDVLQETNLVLWRKGASYDSSRPFMPWACTVAHFQVKAALRDRSRERLILDPQLLDLLAVEEETNADLTDATDRALGNCLEELPDERRDLILQRYQTDASVADMAKQLKLSPGALSVQLHRIRAFLEKCVKIKLNQEAL